MKKTFILILCTLSTLGLSAQSKTENFKQQAKSVAEKIRYTTEEFLRYDNGHDDSGDLVRVKGYYYMPIYDTNIYHESDGESLMAECQKQFAERYPKATIMSISIPQTQWTHEVIKKKKEITGYLEKMYCYIIAQDGNDGYINSRFAFKQYKDVGDTYGPLVDYWPKWERVDFLTPELYKKIKSK